MESEHVLKLALLLAMVGICGPVLAAACEMLGRLTMRTLRVAGRLIVSIMRLTRWFIAEIAKSKLIELIVWLVREPSTVWVTVSSSVVAVLHWILNLPAPTLTILP